MNYRRESGARFQMLYADYYLVAVCNRTWAIYRMRPLRCSLKIPLFLEITDFIDRTVLIQSEALVTKRTLISKFGNDFKAKRLPTVFQVFLISSCPGDCSWFMPKHGKLVPLKFYQIYHIFSEIFISLYGDFLSLSLLQVMRLVSASINSRLTVA